MLRNNNSEFSKQNENTIAFWYACYIFERMTLIWRNQSDISSNTMCKQITTRRRIDLIAKDIINSK